MELLQVLLRILARIMNRLLVVFSADKHCLGKCFRKIYDESLKHGVRNLIFVVLNDSVANVIPRVRDVLLNNIVVGISIYIASDEELPAIVSKVGRDFEKVVICDSCSVCFEHFRRLGMDRCMEVATCCS